MPIWLTTYHDFLLQGKTTAASIVSRSTESRLWCQEGARNGLSCLSDFLNKSTPQGYSPTFQQFQGRMSSGNPAYTVSIQNGSIWFHPVHHTRR
ncbi:unnamed protein product, partial [Aphanomyces euteiches]